MSFAPDCESAGFLVMIGILYGFYRPSCVVRYNTLELEAGF